MTSYIRPKAVLRTVQLLLLTLVLLSLMSCASAPSVDRAFVKTRIEKEKVEVYQPLPSRLTDPIPYPPSLSAEFTNEDLIQLVYEFYDLVDDLNADRADAKEITSASNSNP